MTRRLRANTEHLRDWLRTGRGVDLADYEALRQWSVQDLPRFWQAMWDYFDLRSPTPIEAVLSDAHMPGARWFTGARLNFAGQVLRHAVAGQAAGVPAVVFRNERLQAEGRSLEIGWGELAEQVGAMAAALRALGVGPGDRVAAYLPNVPQTLVGFLACATLGAVWSLTAPDMGVGTVRDRFRQIEPKVLLACDGTVHGGKTVDRRATVAALLAELPRVQTLVLVPYLEEAGAAGGPFPFDAAPWAGRVCEWRSLLGAARDRVQPEAMPFDHPLWVVYSSGTTGLPKPIVHGHGGTLIEMMKSSAFHLDLRPSFGAGAEGLDERYFWYSSTGWIMWNLGAGVLLRGTTLAMFDSHPSWPEPETLWRFAEAARVTFFGAGSAYYAGCLKNEVAAGRCVDTRRLRTLGATGSPLSPEAQQWGQREMGPDMWWAVISGGTDFAGAFIGGTPELPTVAGEMQAVCLGADVQAWSEQGRPLVDEVGELVCVQPMPSMPIYFWGDADGKRYRESYFDMFPGVWRHGDWLRITPAGTAIIYGRSDATLNRHGLRLGTAELYNAVEAVPEVVDSLVVDIEVLGEPPFMPLFVVLREGATLDAPLRERIVRSIREGLSPRFVPDQIVQVAEVPRTLTGKKQELPVKKLLLGRALQDVVNKDACANPQAFDWYERYAQQHRAALKKA